MFSEDEFLYAEASATNTTNDVLGTSPLELIDVVEDEVVDAREDDVLAEVTSIIPEITNRDHNDENNEERGAL